MTVITTNEFRKLALSFPETVELPHFDRTSFRFNKKIFATLQTTNEIAMLKLSDENQSLYCSIDKSAIYPVPNKWGEKGATTAILEQLSREEVQSLIDLAYAHAVSKKPTR